MIRRLALISALCALSPVSTAVAAEDAAQGDAALDRLLPVDQPLCFMRAYDAAHLKANPRQTVTFMSLRRGYGELALEKDRREAAIKTDPQSARFAQATLRVAFRDTGAQRWDGGATCDWQDGRILCESTDCDGGSFELRAGGRDEILVVIQERPEQHLAFGVGDGCGAEGAGRSVGLSVDDGLFKLKRAPLAQCR